MSQQRSPLAVEPELLPGLRAFLDEQGIGLELVPLDDPRAADCPVRAVRAPGKASTVKELRAEGWIPCAAAFYVAGRLGLSPRSLGAILNHLHVKIRHCQLGCFK